MGLARKEYYSKWRQDNREKAKTYAKEYNSKPENIERRKDQHYQRTYGITLEQARYLKNGGCSICGLEGEGDKLHIDHDHASGHVRGALCAQCNKALGLFQDSPELLEYAAKYLRNTMSSTAVNIPLNRRFVCEAVI